MKRLASGNADLSRFLFGYSAAVHAEKALLIAPVVYAYERGGAGVAGLAAFAMLSARILAAPFAAKAAAGSSPNGSLVRLFLVESLVLGLACLAAWLSAPVPVVVAGTGAAIGCISFLRPLSAVVTPGLVESALELTKTNLRTGIASNMSSLFGPLGAAAMIGLGGPALAITACAVLNLLAGLVTWPFRHLDVAVTGATESKGVVKSFIGHLKTARGRKSIPPLLAVAGTQYVYLGSADLIYVVLSSKNFELGRSGPALLSALFGVGALVNGLTARRFIARGKLAPLVLGSLGLMAVCMLALGTKTTLIVTIAALPLMGFGRSLLDLTVRMLLQRSAPPSGVAAVFAMVELLSGVGAAAGAILTRFFIESFGVRSAVYGVAGIFCLVLVATTTRVRRADDEAQVPVVAISLLRTLPVFAAMSPSELELVAGSGREVAVSAGDVVITEGEPGDSFYAVSAGTFDVFMRGEHMRRVNRGGSFGDVALLADVPRTATIIAATDGRLLAIDRGPFLRAVTGQDLPRETAWSAIRKMRFADEVPIP